MQTMPYIARNSTLPVTRDPVAWQARLLYADALHRAWLARLWSRLTGRRSDLVDPGIAARMSARRLYSWHKPGLAQTVSIVRVLGSMRSASPFDRSFLPQPGHQPAQWLRIAGARLLGRELPPVELLQTGDFFLAHDGHYRLSVARALGQETVDAIVWQLPLCLLCPEARQEITRLSSAWPRPSA